MSRISTRAGKILTCGGKLVMDCCDLMTECPCFCCDTETPIVKPPTLSFTLTLSEKRCWLCHAIPDDFHEFFENTGTVSGVANLMDTNPCFSCWELADGYQGFLARYECALNVPMGFTGPGALVGDNGVVLSSNANAWQVAGGDLNWFYVFFHISGGFYCGEPSPVIVDAFISGFDFQFPNDGWCDLPGPIVGRWGLSHDYILTQSDADAFNFTFPRLNCGQWGFSVDYFINNTVECPPGGPEVVEDQLRGRLIVGV